MNSHQHSSLSSSNVLKFSIILAILLVSFSIFYYLVIFLPQKNDQQLEQRVQLEGFNTYKETTAQQNAQACVEELNKRIADPSFAEKFKGVRVNSQEAKVILDYIKQQKDECYKKNGL